MLFYLDIKISVVKKTTLGIFSRIILNLAIGIAVPKFPNELFSPIFWRTSELGQICFLPVMAPFWTS